MTASMGTTEQYYEIGEEGTGWYDTIAADSIEAALDVAEGNVDRTDYPDEWTGHQVVMARRVGSDAPPAHRAVYVPPEEPACADGEEHDWRSPLEVVGGIAENPGVWGHGGGVTITEVCAHCGQYRETDTWADDGRGGVCRTVEYRDADDASRAWVEERRMRTRTLALTSVLREIGDVEVDGDHWALPASDEPDARLEEVARALPSGYTASYDGEDIVIVWEES